MPPFKVLIVNPNTTTSMTDALKPIVEELGYNNTEYTFFTNPSPDGPPSINSPSDAALSTTTILPFLKPLLPSHDAFLVACYSPHPLVSALRSTLAAHTSTSHPQAPRKPVLGIFEASLSTALSLCSYDRQSSSSSLTSHDHDKFGIVSTGKIWESVLGSAVADRLGLASDEAREGGAEGQFAGVQTTGLTATELHEVPREVVKRKLEEATERLVKIGEVKAVVLGCAGMAGMEEWVRGGVGEGVWVVDGVKAGVGGIQAVLRGGF